MRVTEGRVREQVVSTQFYVFPGTTLTVCALKLKNGFVVTGTNVAASEASFSFGVGEKLAEEDAIRKIWDLEQYLARAILAGRVQ